MQQRKASPEEQGQYKKIVTQIIDFATDEQVAQQLEDLAGKIGPVKALIQVVGQALQGIGQAAKQAGVSVASSTGKPALREALMLLVGTMMSSGLIKENPQDVVQQVLAALTGGQNGAA